jgi:hypothetical protein
MVNVAEAWFSRVLHFFFFLKVNSIKKSAEAQPLIHWKYTKVLGGKGEERKKIFLFLFLFICFMFCWVFNLPFFKIFFVGFDLFILTLLIIK